MSNIPLSFIQAYQSKTFRTAPGTHLTSKKEAIAYANERGFIFFWSIKGFHFPSLWAAVAGNRPVADEHDDPGHITWGWKDGLLGTRSWYYARLLRRKNTIISLEALPYFYALSPNYGEPEQDYLIQYEQGLMTQEARLVYEALLREGPLDTLALRKAARLNSPESEGRFNRALEDLQIEFRLLPVGVAEVGPWRYAFIYDLTHRHFPDLIDQAGSISESIARQKILSWYFLSLGASSVPQAAKFFHWRNEEISHAVHSLEQQGFLLAAEIEDLAGESYLLSDLRAVHSI
jgi:hypothetical protein